MIAVRLDEDLVARVDRERARLAISRARAIHEALAAWLERLRLEQAIRREHEGYERLPVSAGEFGAVLGAQRWPT
jgi:metal-responsive CopG/Arc/MetJ family transcriptional regulator